MAKLYVYAGPDDIRRQCAGAPGGMRVESVGDLLAWMSDTGQEPEADGLVWVTFVVDSEGWLRVADRRSEHVACAEGGPVRSAGEMAFEVRERDPALVEVTNQSTGFCPEPESWPEVAAALDGVPLSHPGAFTLEVVFRRCPSCGQTNVVKEGWFFCETCEAALPEAWNFG